MKSNLTDFSCIWLHLKSHQRWSPPCGDGWTLRAGIEMIINLSGHPMSVTQCYLIKNNTNVTNLHHFQVIECDVYCLWLFMYGYSGQQCCVKHLSFISILK